MLKAFQVSAMAAECKSEIVRSFTAGAIFATNSMRPGMSSFAQRRSSTLPEAAAPIKVLAHWAAVRDSCEDGMSNRIERSRR